MKKTVFVDGQHGTTGLKIRERLHGREDIEVIEIPEAKRKDPATKTKLLNEADIVFHLVDRWKQTKPNKQGRVGSALRYNLVAGSYNQIDDYVFSKLTTPGGIKPRGDLNAPYEKGEGQGGDAHTDHHTEQAHGPDGGGGNTVESLFHGAHDGIGVWR